MTDVTEVVGLVPAAGFGRRLGTQASKEALPLVRPAGGSSGDSGARPVATWLLDSMVAAGIRRALIARRCGKWDLAVALGDGAEIGIRLSYAVLSPTPGVPFTLARASRLLGSQRIAFGFPDVLFQPRDAVGRLLRRQAATSATLALALFPTDSPWRTDMVELDGRGRPVALELRPAETDLQYAWVLAAWAPAFTRYLVEFVERVATAHRPGEIHMGHVIRAALRDGLDVTVERFPDGRFLDVGTPEDLVAARRWPRAARRPDPSAG